MSLSNNITIKNASPKTISDALIEFTTSMIGKLADKYGFDHAEAAEFINVVVNVGEESNQTCIKDASTATSSVQQEELFARIAKDVSKNVDANFIESTKTKKGNTQASERDVIKKIKKILDGMKLTYTEAGSQQSKDFRNVGGIGLNIEIKKTDSMMVYFNDTCPSKDIWYIIIFTGKKNKKNTEYIIPPQLLYINGAEFIKDSPWLEDYIQVITTLKDKYARGESKNQLPVIMEVYPRPTFKAKIEGFLK